MLPAVWRMTESQDNELNEVGRGHLLSTNLHWVFRMARGRNGHLASQHLSLLSAPSQLLKTEKQCTAVCSRKESDSLVTHVHQFTALWKQYVGQQGPGFFFVSFLIFFYPSTYSNHCLPSNPFNTAVIELEEGIRKPISGARLSVWRLRWQ